MLHSCYKSLVPPTGVRCSIKSKFTSSTDTNLIVSRANFLDIYTLNQKKDDNAKTHLTLIRTFELFGNIQSIKCVTFTGDDRDSLLISFEEEAKVSVVMFDEEKNDLKTISLHYFEDDFMKEGRTQFTFPKELRLDPQHRCATLIMYDSKLVRLPFRQQKSVLDDHSAAKDDLTSSHKLELPVGRQLITDLKSLNIRHVKDFCFLHGYYEPTLLFLHENEPTWSGRLAVKRNTCSLTAISLDLNSEIWRVDNLPYDCYKLIPIRESVGGGAVVLARNSILHVNQRANYGLSLNDFVTQNDPEVNVVFEPADNNIFLDCCSFSFLSDNRILLSVQTGELYVLHLFSAGSSIRKMILARSKTSVPAEAMVTLNEHFVFLGSRLANSLLVHYSEEKKRKLVTDSTTEELEPSRKKRKGDSGEVFSEAQNEADKADEDFLLALDEDTERQESDMGTSTEETEDDLVSYNFRVHDIFMNVGPSSSMTVVDTTKHLTQYSSRKAINNNNLEVVMCSGHGKNGCLSLLQRNIRPEINRVQELPFEVRQMWTVKHEVTNKQGKIESLRSDFDQFMIISADMKQQDSWRQITKVLKSAESLEDTTGVKEFEFITSEHTLAAGNALQNTRIVQVCLKRVAYLGTGAAFNEEQKLKFGAYGAKRISTINFDKEIRHAVIRDQYILIHFKDGSFKIFSAAENRLDEVATFGEEMSKFGKVTAATLYYSPHTSGLFNLTGTKPSEYFAIVAWSSGVIEILRVPDCAPVFTFLHFLELHRLLIDQSEAEIKDFSDAIDDESIAANIRYPFITEICMRGVGSGSEFPHLVVSLSDDSIYAYRAFIYRTKAPTTGRLSNLRFMKVRHDELLPTTNEDNDDKLDLNSTNIFGDKGIRYAKFIPFTNIGNLGGVFVAGRRPQWLLSERGELRVQPMTQDGSVRAFTSFHNAKCSRGFNYITGRVNFKMCQLLEGDLVRYNSYWPTRKLYLFGTPHLVAYQQETQCVIVCTSVPTRVKVIEDDMEDLPDSGRYPPATERKYTLRLFSAITWEEMDKHELLPHEQVLSMRSVFLAKEEVPSDDEEDDYGLNDDPVVDIRDKELLPFLAVGTGFAEGEDQMSKGRVLLFDLEPRLQSGSPNAFDLTLVTAKELKGPVSTLAQLEGYLAVSMGAKLYVYYFDFKNKQLFPASFWDAQFYVASMNSIKSYLLYGDIYKSVHFLRWREKGHRLSLLAKDYDYLHVYTTEFIVNNKLLGLVVADRDKNLQVFMYAPQRGGKKLVPCADFHIGAYINTMIRLKSRIAEEDRKTAVIPDKQFIMLGTLDGGVGYLAPIPEDMYRRFYVLQNKMYTQLEHVAGLHPKAFRLFRQTTRTAQNYKKNIIDGQLLWRFSYLDARTQKTLAQESGTSVQQILRNIQYLQKSTFFF